MDEDSVLPRKHDYISVICQKLCCIDNGKKLHKMFSESKSAITKNLHFLGVSVTSTAGDRERERSDGRSLAIIITDL